MLGGAVDLMFQYQHVLSSDSLIFLTIVSSCNSYNKFDSLY